MLTLDLSQYSKTGSMFSSSEPVEASSDCCRLGNMFVLARQTSPSSAGEWSQELRPLNLWLPSGTAFREIARWSAGPQTWTQTWTLPPDQRVAKFYGLWNHSINCVEFEFFLVSYWRQISAKQSNISKAHAPHWIQMQTLLAIGPVIRFIADVVSKRLHSAIKKWLCYLNLSSCLFLRVRQNIKLSLLHYKRFFLQNENLFWCLI